MNNLAQLRIRRGALQVHDLARLDIFRVCKERQAFSGQQALSPLPVNRLHPRVSSPVTD